MNLFTNSPGRQYPAIAIVLNTNSPIAQFYSKIQLHSLFKSNRIVTRLFAATILFIAAMLSPGLVRAQADDSKTTTVCGYEVKTEIFYNTPISGQTKIVWTVTNTNPGNGDNGTYQNLSHFTQEVCFSSVNVAKANVSINFKDPSQDCLAGSNIFKLDKGTNGSTPTVYELTLYGGNYTLALVNAAFKSGSSLDGQCCPGQIYGLACSECAVTPGSINSVDPICTGSDAAEITNVTSGTGSSYQWQSSTVGCDDEASFSNIEGATAETYDPPALTQTTYFRRVSITSDNCRAASNCITITVNAKVDPIFDEIPAFCEGSTAPILPSESKNGISGIWNPALVDNTTSGKYVFTPDAGECANPFELNIVVNKKVTPEFDPISAICNGGSFTLPTTSKNGIDGKWSPEINTSATTEYTFTPDEGECANIFTLTVVVKPNPSLTVKDISNTCPASTANLASAVVSYTTGATLTYYQSDCTTPVNPAAVGSGTYCIKVVKDGCTTTKTVTVTINLCPQGCTPGYWKNRKASWSTIKTINDELTCINTAAGTALTGDLKAAPFKTVFVVSDAQMIATLGSKTLTLLGAAGLGDGSGYTQLGRAAAAALLNSCALVPFSNFAGYPYSTSQIIAETKAVFAVTPLTTASRQAALTLAIKYDKANNSTCVLDNSVKYASSPGVETEENLVVTQLAVSTFPNPYTDKVRFVISNPKAAQGNLQVYNMLGQKIKTVFQGQIPAGKQTFDFIVPPTRRSNLIYMLTVGNEKVTGKIVQAIK